MIGHDETKWSSNNHSQRLQFLLLLSGGEQPIVVVAAPDAAEICTDSEIHVDKPIKFSNLYVRLQNNLSENC